MLWLLAATPGCLATERIPSGCGCACCAEDTVKPDSSITHEVFFDLLEKEIQKVHNFTHKKVSEAHQPAFLPQ
jgi:hypothetical protein